MTTRPPDLDGDEREALAGLEDQLDVIRARHRGDPPLALLRAADHDVLPPALQEAVGDHLRDDPWSRALVAGIDTEPAPLDAAAETRLLRRIERESGRTSTPARGWWRVALAGGGVVAALVAVMLRPSAPPAPAQAPAAAPPATRSDAPAPGPASAPALAPTPTPGAPVVAFEPAEVKLSMAALTWRGAAADSNPMLSAFAPAFAAYRAGRYPPAAAAFATLAGEYPEAVEPPFYQGVSLMLTGDFAGAVAPLAAVAATADATFGADAAWYLGVAELRLGRVAEGRARLERVCADTRHGAACAAVATLSGR